MITFIINAIKIIFLLGFLVFIHEGGHFLIAKWCKVKVNEFSIGFGPSIWKKQGKETKYNIRLLPLGGFVDLEGEQGNSDSENSFSKASIPKRMAIVLAGPLVNIVFGILVYFLLILFIKSDFSLALFQTKEFLVSMFEGIKMLFTGQVGVNDFMGPVGISEVVVNTTRVVDYIYIFALISLSLGITNLLPIPALDGGRLLLIIIEAIRRKKISERVEMNIGLIGFSLLIILSLYVTYNDILRIL